MRKLKLTLMGILYWILQLTWGSLMTLLGIIVTIIALLFLRGKIHLNGFGFITEFGGNWGGLSLGAFSFCGNYRINSFSYYEKTRNHEFGHSLQNIILGPLMPFVVGIPSAVRYWYKRIAEKKGKRFPRHWYYQIWFESTASSWGYKALSYIEYVPEVNIPGPIIPDSSI